MKIIDIHTHVFPDPLAERAVPALEAEASIKAFSDGKLSSLLASMDRAGVAASVVCSIATKPEQFSPILKWSAEISSERIIPFPSIHPDDPDALEHIKEIRSAGFSGIKLHPYYQNFSIDEPRIYSIFRKTEEEGLILLLHTGFDIAYPFDRIADPEKTARIITDFPGLRLVTSHLGAWYDWDEVEKHLLGKPVFMDISVSIPFLGPERAKEMLLRHPADFLLYGSDSPWDDQLALKERVLDLNLPDELTEKIFYKNAQRLLGKPAGR